MLNSGARFQRKSASLSSLYIVQVSLSSLNRHAVATRADVGLPKATVLERHFRDILPEAKVLPLGSSRQLTPTLYDVA